MEARLSATLGLPSPNPNHHHHHHHVPVTDFTSLFTHFTALTSTQNPKNKNPQIKPSSFNWLKFKPSKNSLKPREPCDDCTRPIFFNPPFASISASDSTEANLRPEFIKWSKPTSRNNPRIQTLMKNLSVFERALFGAGAGGISGAFTHACLHPLDTIKTKLQTKGASEVYNNTFDAIVKTFQSKGIVGFYSGVSAVIVGSTFSSAVYFGTCEFGKSLLSNFPKYPSVLIPPTAGAVGNIVSSAIMVPKELITQRMQAGAQGRSYEIFLKILEKDGILGLYSGYFATLLRNLPAGVLSYSSFEYLKAAVLSRKKKTHLEPIQSVCCGALAGAISASMTTPLDVLKTRLMTQVHGEAMNKVATAMQTGLTVTVRQILKEEGWVGFTRGMGPRVVHNACFSALGYFAFETARLTILNEYLKRKEASEVSDVVDS